MHMPINKSNASYAATMGAAFLLSVTVPNGAFAQASAEGSATARIQAETLLISATGQDEIVAALRAQGFTVTEVGSTLLGRIRIVARSELGIRELVVHRSTGEILRDVLVPASASMRAGTVVNAEGSSSVSNTTAGSSASGGAGASAGIGGGAKVDGGTGGTTAGDKGTASSGASTSVDVGVGASSVGGSVSIEGGISLGN